MISKQAPQAPTTILGRTQSFLKGALPKLKQKHGDVTHLLANPHVSFMLLAIVCYENYEEQRIARMRCRSIGGPHMFVPVVCHDTSLQQQIADSSRQQQIAISAHIFAAALLQPLVRKQHGFSQQGCILDFLVMLKCMLLCRFRIIVFRMIAAMRADTCCLPFSVR